MKRILWIVLTPFMIVAAYLMIFHIDWVIVPPFTNVGAEAFDHSQCQYPNRLSNPPDGCDNTDPCDPSNTKGGSGDCKQDNYSDPHRPEYDNYGNEYIDGQFVKLGQCVTDTISKIYNPHCQDVDAINNAWPEQQKLYAANGK